MGTDPEAKVRGKSMIVINNIYKQGYIIKKEKGTRFYYKKNRF